MQENSFEIRQAIANGLRKDENPAVNAAYMDRLENLVPNNGIIERHEAIARPGALLTDPKEFPFPMAFKGDKVRVLLGDTTAKTMDANFATTPVTLNLRDGGTGTITLGGPWHFESFMEYWFATNGTSFIYKVPTDDGDAYIADAFSCQSVCRYDNRVVLGGLSGSWLAGSRWLEFFATCKETTGSNIVLHEDLAADTSWLIYSESGGGAVDIPFHSLACACGLLGNDAFDDVKEILWDSVERGDIGLIPLRKTTTIRCVKQLGRRIIVYGENSISEVAQSENGFREDLIADFGIGGRGCVGGNDRRHVFIGNDGRIYSFYANQDQPEELDYSMWIDDMILSRTTVSHNPIEDRYWISDGRYCYVLTQSGLGGPMTTMPSSLFVDVNKMVVGTYKTPNTDEWHLQTARFDVSERDWKHLTCTHLHGSGYNDATATAYGSYKLNSSMNRVSAPVNDEGVAYLPLSFLDGYLYFTGSGSDVNFTTIEIRYQGEGKRHRRGTSGQPTGD